MNQNNYFDKLSAKEVANLLNISVQAVRFYEKKGLIHPRRNPENNYREYDYTDVSKLYYSLKFNRIGISLSDFPQNVTSFNSIDNLQNAVTNRSKEIQMDYAICQYVQDSIAEERSYWEKNETVKELDDLNFYAMDIKEVLDAKYSDDWKKLIPISSLSCKWNINGNNIQISNIYIIREKYFDMIKDQIEIPLKNLKSIHIHHGIQIIIKVNPSEETDIYSFYHKYKLDYPSLKSELYSIPLLTLNSDNNHVYHLIKMILIFN